MGTLYITEFTNLGRDRVNAETQIAELPPLAQQTVTTSGTSAQSAALNAETRFVRVMASADTSIRVAVNPTAVATDMRLAAGLPEYFAVRGGLKIAGIE